MHTYILYYMHTYCTYIFYKLYMPSLPYRLSIYHSKCMMYVYMHAYDILRVGETYHIIQNDNNTHPHGEEASLQQIGALVYSIFNGQARLQ